MSGKSVVKVHAIFEFFADESKLIELGENAYESNHVENYYFDGETRIEGQVHASTKDKIYNIKIVLQADGGIKYAECTCSRRCLKCHHMAALLMCCHYNLSNTGTACQSASKNENDIKTIDELYPVPSNQKDYVAVEIEDPEKLKREIYEKVKHLKSTGICWLLSPEPVVEDIVSHDI